MTLIELTKAYHLQGSDRIGLLPRATRPDGRLPWAILGRAFGAEDKRPQEWLLSMADQLRERHFKPPLAL